MPDPPKQSEPDDPTLVSPRGRKAFETTVTDEERAATDSGGAPAPPTGPPPAAGETTIPAGGLSVAMPDRCDETLTSQGLYSRGAEINRGGMGHVSAAWDHNLQRQVAVKELLSIHRRNEEAGERFLREAFLTGGLEHPGIVPVHHFGVNADGLPFYTMKYIGGQTLEEAIRGLKDLPPREANVRRLCLLQRVHQACQAIAFAHTRGVIHRDIKPSNIMLGEYGETVVLDWGVAKKIEDERQIPGRCPNSGEIIPGGARAPVGPLSPPPGVLPAAYETPTPAPGREPAAETSGDERSPRTPMGGSSTHAGAIVGTPAYMPPEQATGDLEHLGPAADVFSLGATLYCLMTGRAPYGDVPPQRILEAAAHGRFRRPSRLAPDIPPALETIILRAMAPNPADRYGSACELAAELERFLTGQLVRAHQYTWFEKAMNWYRRHRIAVLTFLLLGVATNAVALVITGLQLTQAVTGTLLWIADAQVQRSLVLTEEWLAPVEGMLNLVEDVAHRSGADAAAAEPALERLKGSLQNVELVYYAIDDGTSVPITVGSAPERRFPEGMDPRTRPWYSGALAAGGAMAITDPYADVNTGLTCVSVSRYVQMAETPATDLIVAADVYLLPLIEILRPRNFPRYGAAVLLTAVDPAVPQPARWQTAKPILVASTLAQEIFPAPGLVTEAIDPNVFDTATQDAARRMVRAIRDGVDPDAMLDVKALLPEGTYTDEFNVTVETAAIVDLGGEPHAVFTAPVPEMPWEISVVIPMALLTRPFVHAGALLLRTASAGFVVALLVFVVYYTLRARRTRRQPADTFTFTSAPPSYPPT